MGRGGGGGSRGGGGFGGGRSSSRSHVQNAPKPVSKAPPPAPVSNAGGQSLMGTFGANVVHAVTWGFGASVGHRVGEFIFGPHTVHVEHIPTTAAQSTSNTSGAVDSCSSHHKAFEACLNTSSTDISKCQFYLDMLSECRRSHKLSA